MCEDSGPIVPVKKLIGKIHAIQGTSRCLVDVLQLTDKVS